MENKFKEELTQLLNKHSMENGCNTPDFILAEYLLNCLAVFNNAVNKRVDWYGREKNNCIIQGITPEDHEKLTDLFNETKPLPCPNCGEGDKICACMRNICKDCGKPVGNITFSVCDKCWDNNSRNRRLIKVGEAFDDVWYKLRTEHYFIRNDKENRNRLIAYTQLIMNHMNFNNKFCECYEIVCDESNNPPVVVDSKQIICHINYFDKEYEIEINKQIVLDLYEPKEFFNKKCNCHGNNNG